MIHTSLPLTRAFPHSDADVAACHGAIGGIVCGADAAHQSREAAERRRQRLMGAAEPIVCRAERLV